MFGRAAPVTRGEDLAGPPDEVAPLDAEVAPLLDWPTPARPPVARPSPTSPLGPEVASLGQIQPQLAIYF